ncbi:MAG: succinate dehydrogenase cytochrome b subunit [Elusimicrobia bacterium]|nr:succinate dehydrogenase cytochrome b subunit [Elusimicrobiota bacterium]
MIEFARSSIGKKVLVALAGLFLCLFLVTHLAGNLFLLVGENAFNHYAEALEKNPLLIVAEFGLAALFLIHILVSLQVKYEDRRARPIGYLQQKSKGGSSWGSRTMIFSGLLLLVFLVVHIKTFKFGDAGEGLFRLVVTAFQNKFYVAFYVLAMSALGLHLSHGFQSAFQTLGVEHPGYTPWIKKAGCFFSALIAGGFALLPLWAYFNLGGH